MIRTAPVSALVYRRRRAAGPCGSSGPEQMSSGRPSTAPATRWATARGAGGTSTEPSRSAPRPTCRPVAMAMHRAPRAARSSSGSLISTPRSLLSEMVVARIESRPRVTRSVSAPCSARRKFQNTAM